MYCSTCGVAIAPGLSYCNYCGAKLGAAKLDDEHTEPQVKPELLVSAMVAVFVLGIAAITVLMGVMKTVLDPPAEAVFVVVLLCFLLMFFLEAVFLRLLFRRNRATKKAGSNTLSRGQATKELEAPSPRVLSEPISSVTDHTTRAFDPILTERQKQ